MTRTARTRFALACSAALMTLAGGVGILWHITEGFSVFTAEGARRAAVARGPQRVPQHSTQWQDGSTSAHIFTPGRVTVVDFIYTRCTTLCLSLGGSMGQLERTFKTIGYAEQVQLISLSLDPMYDSPPRLAEYLQRFGAGPAWKAGHILDERHTREVLRAFGIVAIPDGMGGIEHNAALHVINASGQLVGIFDTADLNGVTQAVTQLIKNSPQ